jgi:UDP-N-acetylglucosamine--N-acetylmuramyl-(pentapeptide) pyrophosphoryl-undecaprenol N-acetylglucosamine transferase
VRPEFFGLGDSPGGPRLGLLVCGGSRGARSINRAVTSALPALARIEPAPRIVHQTGPDDEAAVRAAYAVYPAELHEVHAFLDDMPQRFAAADLVVSRSGASTIAELCAAGRSAILVPYPHAADDHQRHNAETLEQTGAAILVPDSTLAAGALERTIAELAADPVRRRAMAHAARALARPGAAERIADLAEGLMEGRDVS